MLTIVVAFAHNIIGEEVKGTSLPFRSQGVSDMRVIDNAEGKAWRAESLNAIGKPRESLWDVAQMANRARKKYGMNQSIALTHLYIENCQHPDDRNVLSRSDILIVDGPLFNRAR